MILLEDDLPGPLTIEQASFKSYLPSKKIYLSRTTGQDFIEPHIIIIIVIIISHVKMYVLFYSCFLLCSFFKDVYILTFSLHFLTFTIVSDWRPNIVHFPSYITIPFPRKARLNDDYLTFSRIEFQNSLHQKDVKCETSKMFYISKDYKLTVASCWGLLQLKNGLLNSEEWQPPKNDWICAFAKIWPYNVIHTIRTVFSVFSFSNSSFMVLLSSACGELTEDI